MLYRASVGNSTGRVAGYSLISLLEKIQNLIVFNYFSIYTLFLCRICIWSLTQFPIFWLFFVKTTLELILITCQPISGRVDATRCSKLTGGFPPVPPALTEALQNNSFPLYFKFKFKLVATAYAGARTVCTRDVHLFSTAVYRFA